MCGIAGFFCMPECQNEGYALRALHAMAYALAHRGPDGEGCWVDTEARVGFLQRRLAILDLTDAGKQPMFSASGRYVIVYNGEIYNHLALRRALEARNAALVWRGHSDTETLLALLDEFGVEGSLRRLAGMFAFALWDRSERKLYFARDRMGEKPLYYARMGQGLLFGSELKALWAYPGFSPAIDNAAVAAYMRFGYVPHPHTIFEGVYKLSPAHLLCVDSSTGEQLDPKPYWSLREVAEAGTAAARNGRFEDFVDETEALLSDVVESQMLSDVPLGVFLSGGVGFLISGGADASTLATASAFVLHRIWGGALQRSRARQGGRRPSRNGAYRIGRA